MIWYDLIMNNLNRGTNLPFFKAIINNFNQLDPVKVKACIPFNGSLTFFKCASIVLSCVGFVLQINPVVSQTISAEEQIVELKEGLLIVILPSFSKKIQSLEAARSQVKNEKRLNKLIANAKWERDSFQMELMNAIEEMYTFSNYAYLVDTHLKTFFRGNWSHVKYGTDYRDQPDMNKVFFIRNGETPNGAQALLICDHQVNALTKPFPYFVRLNSFVSIFESFFKPTPIKWKPLSETITKLNARLEAYYTKVN